VTPGDLPGDDIPHPIPIEESIDLHPFAPGEVVSVVEEYLDAAASKGYREVRLIHGKGKGIQRAAVRAALSRNPRVESFTDASADAGGWGATQVILRQPG
jgi:dsDNA-specific endonuclease/ATPase MutS2